MQLIRDKIEKTVQMYALLINWAGDPCIVRGWYFEEASWAIKYPAAS